MGTEAYDAAPTPARATFRDVLADREFRALYVAQTLSVVGDMVARIAVALVVYERSRSSLLTATTFAVSFLPWLLGGPLLSSVADRLPRRRVLVVCDLSRALLVAALALPGMPVWMLFTLLAVATLFEPPFQAARAALLPDVLGDGDRYVVGSSLSNTTVQFGQVLGFAIGGALVALLTASGAILVDAATFAVSALLIARRVTHRPPVATGGRTDVLRDAREGVRAVFGHPLLRAIVLLSWTAAACTIGPESIAVPYAAAHGGGSVAAGLLTAAIPAGMVLGSILLGRYVPRRTTERLLRPLTVACLLPLALTAFDPPIWLAVMLWMISGAAAAFQITANRIFVATVPREVRGRAFGIAVTGLITVQGLAALLAGWLATQVTPGTAIADLALPGLAVVAVLLVAWPRERENVSTPDTFLPTQDNSQEKDAFPVAAPPSTDARPRPEPRVWAYIGMLAVVAALATTIFGRWHPYAPSHLGWPPIALLFVIVTAYPLHFEFRRQPRSVQLDYVPLVLGLYFLAPTALIVTRLVATLFARGVIRRQPGIRVAFNVAANAVHTSAAIVVFRLLTPSGADVRVGSWPAAFGATVVDELMSTAAVAVVIYLYERRIHWLETARPLLFATSADVVNTCLALVTANAIPSEPNTIWAVTVFIIVALAGFRGYHELADRHASLDRLYAFSRGLGPVVGEPEEIAPALTELRQLLRADRLELALLRPGASDATVISVWDEDDREEVGVREAALDDASLALLRRGGSTLATNRRGLLRVRRRRSTFNRDRMAVPIGTPEQPLAVLRAEHRSGEVRSFDEKDLRLLEAVADQLGAALEKGRLVESLRQAAARDSLTGLANLDTVRQFLTTTLEGGGGAVVLLIDLDRFHDVNDTLGHEAGDAVLLEVAHRLEDASTRGSLPCRVGGDQFALVLPGAAGNEVARLAALAVKSRLEGSIRLGDLSADVRVTIGMARAPEHGADGATLLRRAEMAMAAAKGTSSGISEWEPNYESDGSRRLHVVSGLRVALSTNDLRVEYQPKIRLGTGEVTGLEALCRWRHPELGAISPAEFVPLAEATGLVSALTSNVMRMALENCRRWHDSGRFVGVSVNISARSLDDPILVGQVAALLTASGIEPHWLTLEITESSVMENPAKSLEVLRQLRSLGVRLSIDDFGTGYSSLHYLRGLPVHEVKIDKAFVDAVDRDGADRAVVRAVVELSESLGLTTVAEGVEQASQALTLESLGVEEVQGFFYARPMTDENTLDWLRNRPTASHVR